MEAPIVLAIDFDDTIVETSWPTIVGFKPDAKKYLQKLKDEGYYIIIWTCRYGDKQEAASTFLKENGVEFDLINEHHPVLIECYKNDTRKISADIYIDDKCLFGLPNSWEEIYQLIHKRTDELHSSNKSILKGCLLYLSQEKLAQERTQ